MLANPSRGSLIEKKKCDEIGELGSKPKLEGGDGSKKPRSRNSNIFPKIRDSNKSFKECLFYFLIFVDGVYQCQ